MRIERSATPTSPAPLGLWDAVSIIVGIIVGAGILRAPAVVFQNASSPGQVLLVWVLCSVPALLGALCYAELASAYPRSGGEYVYLTRAYGPLSGFLFAWSQLSVIRPGGGIAIPAFVFAGAAASLWGLDPLAVVLVAALAVAGLTFVNVLGVTPGKLTINLLTVTKVLCLGGLIIAGLFWSHPRALAAAPVPEPVSFGATIQAFFVMMMAVIYTYDGWNEAAYVSREVRDSQRNLPRALILGVMLVTGIYLLVNAAYLVSLGFDGARAMGASPAVMLTETLGATGGQIMNVLIMISMLGALTGMIFTGARIFSEMGADHALFSPLARWSPRWHTPVWSLVVQAAISIAMIVGVGLLWRHKDGFDQLLKCTAPVFYLFFMLTGLALIVLRFKDPATPRPFRVPLYPLTPLLFTGWSGFMLVGSVLAAPQEALVGLSISLIGVPLYFLSLRLRRWEPAGPLAGPHHQCRQWAKELQGTNVED
jgi:amino acid transporter